MPEFEAALSKMPIIAILRGVRPDEASPVGDALLHSGIRIIEVPMNSPDPLESVRALVEHLGDRCIIGAGTVLSAKAVDDVVDAGGWLIVSPNTDGEVIERAVERGCVAVPGIATPTEALYAYARGARYLKLFPASTYGPAHVRALRAVLPQDAGLIAVGGVGPDDAIDWIQSGASGVGIGSEIYRPGDSVTVVSRKANAAVEAVACDNRITTMGR